MTSKSIGSSSYYIWWFNSNPEESFTVIHNQKGHLIGPKTLMSCHFVAWEITWVILMYAVLLRNSNYCLKIILNKCISVLNFLLCVMFFLPNWILTYQKYSQRWTCLVSVFQLKMKVVLSRYQQLLLNVCSSSENLHWCNNQLLYRSHQSYR